MWLQHRLKGAFKVIIVEEPFEVYNVAIEVKWFGNYMHREEIIR
jgi:hypothetical protein